MSRDLTARCYRRLEVVHGDLVAVLMRARARMPDSLGFVVTEGLRTLDRQRQLLEARATRTLHSRHLTGHAADIAVTVTGQVRWDWPLYPRAAAVIKQAAAELEVAIEWGGDWKGFRDGPHFELDRYAYPAEARA
jgi:peptidoglycan L-alanyl-D-glutamate endopeptidase CwlK